MSDDRRTSVSRGSRRSTKTPLSERGGAQTPLEISMAAVENRLRQATLDLVEPTIHKTSILQEDLDHLKERVTNHAKSINDVTQLQVRAHEQVAQIEHFRDEMGKWDTQRRQTESKVNEDVALQREELTSFQHNLAQKESVLNQLNRGLQSTTQEISRFRQGQKDLQNQCQERLDQMSMRIASMYTELEIKMNQLELRHNTLADDLWGDETGLAKVSGELGKTNVQIKHLNDRVAELVESKAPREDLEKLNDDVHSMLREANGNMLGLKRVVGNVVNDVKEHFRTSSNTIAAHNATFIEDIQRSYQKEQAAMEILRKEVNEFLQETRSGNSNLTTQVEEGVQRMDSLVTELRGDMEELNKKRKRDKTAQDIELKGMKKRLGGVFDHSDVVLRGMEHLNGVLHLVLESERVQAALEFQDNIDRKKIALVGMKGDEDSARDAAEIGMARGAGVARAAGMRGGKGSGGAGVMPGDVMSVDTRCISCSGQAPTVMSAFKMACLKYSPSQVEYESALHERRDLILRRQRLLDQAMRALADGAAQTAEAVNDRGLGGDVEFRGTATTTASTTGGFGAPASREKEPGDPGVDSLITRPDNFRSQAPLSGYATFSSTFGHSMTRGSVVTSGTQLTGNPEKDAARGGLGRPSVSPRKSMASTTAGFRTADRKSQLPPMLTPR